MSNHVRCYINIIEAAMEQPSETTVYHLTLSRNLTKIRTDGLQPKIGPRSKKLGEGKPAIYFFPTIEDAHTALNQWFGNEFSDEARIALLAISVPDGVELHSDVEYERHVYCSIPPQNIRVLTKDILGLTDAEIRQLKNH